jgi:hypothetical protein
MKPNMHTIPKRLTYDQLVYLFWIAETGATELRRKLATTLASLGSGYMDIREIQRASEEARAHVRAATVPSIHKLVTAEASSG